MVRQQISVVQAKNWFYQWLKPGPHCLMPRYWFKPGADELRIYCEPFYFEDHLSSVKQHDYIRVSPADNRGVQVGWNSKAGSPPPEWAKTVVSRFNNLFEVVGGRGYVL